jgi:hypothetical protein
MQIVPLGIALIAYVCALHAVVKIHANAPYHWAVILYIATITFALPLQLH